MIRREFRIGLDLLTSRRRDPKRYPVKINARESETPIRLYETSSSLQVIVTHLVNWISYRSAQVGYVQTNHGRYFIEPMNDVEPEEDGQHVHIAYRRDAPHEKKKNQDGAPKRHCTVGGSYNFSFREIINCHRYC